LSENNTRKMFTFAIATMVTMSTYAFVFGECFGDTCTAIYTGCDGAWWGWD